MQKIKVGYIDGCFDLMHIGHIRIIARARCLCKKLIVGVHNDAEIALYKGAPPVVQEAERYAGAFLAGAFFFVKSRLLSIKEYFW